ncbi:MAG: hypothetical protein M3R15_15200, partial [Acidobacteriota bacterium]|nr:hypothetical protein [Acidobacteriota bacterium]
GLRDTLFIAMSNYYYDEKDAYLTALSDTRASNHELMPFLKFGLCGIALQCQRLFAEIKKTNLESVVSQYDVRLVHQTGDHM